MAPNIHSIPPENNNVKANTRGYTLESTFPNLKSSCLRGIPFPNIFDWLKGIPIFKQNILTSE